MKILIIKPSSFGDIIQANPILQSIKTEWKDAQIDWLVFKQWKQVVKLFENVSNIKVWDRKGGIKAFFKVLTECKKEKYDIVIDLQGLLRTAIFARLLNAKQKIGVAGMKESSWLILKEPYQRDYKLNAVVRNLKSLTYLTGKDYNVEFKIEVPDLYNEFNMFFHQYNITPNDKIVSFVPFARGKTKNWKQENYLQLAKMINNLDSNIKIVILGSKSDCEKIQSDQLIDLCGKTDVAMLAYILKKSICVVGSDTGTLHLANAIGVNSVFLFGGSDINETSPHGHNSIVLSANLPCSPCRGKCKYDTERCLEQIKPEMVLENIIKWIK